MQQYANVYVGFKNKNMHSPDHPTPLAIAAPPQLLMIEGRKVSTELAPTTYRRQVWNADNGTQLEHRGDSLTAEQAKRINAHYSVEVHTGVHGQILSTVSNARESIRSLVGKPTQKEYAAVAQIVNGMRPGDTLFVEGIGFRQHMVEPLPEAFFETDTTRPNSEPFNLPAEMGRTILRDELAKMAADLEEQRQNYKINARDYALQLAMLRGINVVWADIDAFEREGFSRNGKAQVELLHSEDPDEAAYASRIQDVREKRAVNTVKDWALKHLPSEGTPPFAEGDKPRVVLMFGSGHTEGLVAKFNDLGLPPAVHEMEATRDIDARLVEQAAHIGRMMVGQWASLFS